MSRWSALFDNGLNATTGVTLASTRAYATVDAAGSTRGVDAPVYSFSRLYASPPRSGDVVTLDGAGAVQRVACGVWPDGQPVIMHQRDVALSRLLNIHVGPTITANALTTAPSRSVDIYCNNTPSTLNPSGRKSGQMDVLFGAGASQGEDADWLNAPTAYQIVGGTPMVVCASSQFVSGTTYETRACSILWWDDRLAGANKWTLLHRSPTFAAGLGRGQQWQFPQATTLGNPNELWIGWVDYLTNPAGTGGQAFICKLTRSGPGQPFIPGGVRRVLQVTSQGANEHLHCAAVVRHGTSGICIVIVNGDTNNARTFAVTLPSEDYMAGDDGNFVFTYTTQAAEEITNGDWRLYPNAGGDRAATLGGTAFTAGSWNNATKVLTAAALNISTIGDRVDRYVVVSGGTGVTTPIQARVTVHSGTSITLPAVDIPNTSDLSGTVCAVQASHQPVACHQMADGRLYFGCDESTRSGTIANLPTFASGDRTIRWEAVGDPLTTHLQEWNQFQAVADPDNRNRFYVGKYESSSFDSDPSGKILASNAGRGFAAIYAPNTNNMSSNGLHGVYTPSGGGDSFILYTTGSTTQAIRAPKYLQTARPLVASSPGIRNHLTAGPYSELGSSAPSTYEVIDRTALPTLVSGHTIPPPPANGPVLRINTRREYSTVRVMTATTVPTNQRVTVTGWIYNLPTLANAASAMLIWVGDGTSIGTAIARTASFVHQRLDGYGWQRVTLRAGLPSGWASGGASVNPCPVALSFRTENGFRWAASDVLFVPESIVTGDVEVPVIAPPVAGDVTYTEASSRLNVPISGTAWTCIMRGSLPPHGSDEYLTDRNASRVLFTLSNGTNSARLTLDPTNNRVSVTDGTNTINCAAPAGQVMHFDRNSQVYVGLALTGTTLTVVASIDGTVLNSASGTFTSMTYDRVLSGDASNANGEPFEWWSCEGFPTALNATQLADQLREPPPSSAARGAGIGVGIRVGV
jgi:hypothetical protein